MSVSTYPHVYVLGCTCRRVTFYAQQCRAFNLVWALFKEGVLAEGDCVGVVGAGLGGMTVAAALALKNCQVTVFEQDRREFHLQRQNVTRYIHPRIYDWPETNAAAASTDLPCLNWHAGKADQVVEQVLDQWQRFVAQRLVSVRKEFTVQDISVVDKRPAINGNGPGWDSVPFDSVILAVGFGKERFLNAFGTKSYWQIDAFHQRDLGHVGVKRILISGCGDGGLIDVLRFSLEDFKQELFLTDFLPESIVAGLRGELLRIEREARAISGGDPGQFLHAEYKKLSLPSDLLETFNARKRDDTVVTLNGSGPTPFTLNASLLNRFCIHILLQLGLPFKPGRLLFDRVKPLSPGYEVTIQKANGNFDTERFDDLILRHGPEPVIDSLLPKADAKELQMKSLSEGDITMTPSWPNGFYVKTPLCDPPAIQTRIGRDLFAMLGDGDIAAALSSSTDTAASQAALPGVTDGIAPQFVFDERANEYSRDIFKALRELDFGRADTLAAEAGEWLQSHHHEIQAGPGRELATVLMRSALSSATRNQDDSSVLATQRDLAKRYRDMAKGFV